MLLEEEAVVAVGFRKEAYHTTRSLGLYSTFQREEREAPVTEVGNKS